jgi:hypothetical protein
MNKKSASEVIDRILTALKFNNDSELCRQLKINRATLGNWRIRDSVPYSLCVNIAEEKNISLDWLLTGEGEMLKGDKAANDAISITPEEAQYLRWLRNMLPEQKKDALAVAEKFGRWNQQVIERQGGHQAAMA